jgi:hypothetical protein
MALICGISSRAEAEPAGTPTQNRIFFNCTFTTSALSGLQSVLNIPEDSLGQLNDGVIQASYILIYVTGNPNDGQRISGSEPSAFTGPILCTNSDIDDIDPTTEAADIPPAGSGADSVDILGSEEVSHLQYQLNFGTTPGDTEKRVCHTVASNTDCFFIRPFGEGGGD